LLKLGKLTRATEQNEQNSKDNGITDSCPIERKREREREKNNFFLFVTALQAYQKGCKPI